MAIPVVTQRPFSRSVGLHIMHQTRGQRLFLHWPVEAPALRGFLPSEVELDTFDGQAWIGIVPISLTSVRSAFMPPFPGLNSFLEVNVRTYVTYRGEPGVWFFSLDSDSAFAVWLARAFYRLPYFRARIRMQTDGDTISFASRRMNHTAGSAKIDVSWVPREPLPKARPGTLEWFVTERYRIFTWHRNRLLCARVWHDPWPLRAAKLNHCETTLLQILGLPEPTREPIVHHCDEVAVGVSLLRHPCADQPAAAILDPTCTKPVSS